MIKKRKLNGKFFATLATLILVLLSLYKVPHFINVTKLEKMGYSKEAIEAIYKRKLRKTIIDNNYYSFYLNKEIVKEDFEPRYLRLYVVNDELSKDHFYLYEKLKETKGYTDDELVEAYSKLDYSQLVDLLVYEKVDIYNYDKEKGNLVLYKNYIEIKDKDAIEVFVSGKYYLSDYVPAKLAPISKVYSTSSLKMESRALKAFEELCRYMSENDMDIYAYEAYRSFLELKDNSLLKAGFNDQQTGLGVFVLASQNDSLTYFTETIAYNYLKDHLHEYGFIIRYPDNKKQVTGVDFVPNYLRYVGIDLATKIYNSGLCFDEYYELFLSSANEASPKNKS